MSFAQAEVKTATKTPEKRKNAVSQLKKSIDPQLVKSPLHRVLSLQRTIGNQAVKRLLESVLLQAKLRIGQPNDVYEQEADRVADSIIHVPELKIKQEEEDGIHCQTLTAKAPSNEILPEKISFNHKSEATHEQENRIRGIKRRGHQLSRRDQTFYESCFNRDLSAVRIHTDGNANQLARELDAKAFTIGQDIVFGAGSYSPTTIEGRRLLAHELTHVIQQGQDKVRNKSVRKRTGKAILQRQPRGAPRSKVVSDLDEATVEEAKSKLRFAKLAAARQSVIDIIVSGIKNKVDFSLMKDGKPVYVAEASYTGRTVVEIDETKGKSPKLKGKPRVLIGPPAFPTVPINLISDDAQEEFLNGGVVHLYSTIMHEYQHVLQWKDPVRSIKIGKPGREVEAHFWEIENHMKTGLSKYPELFKNAWKDATEQWQEFKKSKEWGELDKSEQERYEKWYKRVLEIKERILGK